MFYAQLTNGVVTSVTQTAAELPESANLVEIESFDTGLIGCTYQDGIFNSPTPQAAPLSPIEFKLRFTAPERVAIYQSTDLMVKDFVSLLDDTRLQSIDLTLKSTIDAVDYLVSIGLVDSIRKDEILS
jgi:hypothetical protein